MRQGAWIAASALALGVAFVPAHAAVQTAGNGIVSVLVEDAGPDAGQFTLRTGASHPLPDRTIFYPIGTSYVTLRDDTAQVVYANSGGGTITNLGVYAFASMPFTSNAAIANGFRSSYTLPDWIVVQDVVVVGTTREDTRVRQSVTVTNTSALARSFGVRFLWDWHIADDDITFLRTRSPDGAFTSTFFAVDMPAFGAIETIDDAQTLHAYARLSGGGVFPAATAPDRFGYVSWEDFWPAPWDFPVSGGNGDSATVHYFGFHTPFSLAPGASVTFTQYVATHAGAVGLATASAPSAIPTLSDAALAALAAVLMLLGVRATPASASCRRPTLRTCREPRR